MIRQGDDTNSFGNHFMVVDLENIPDGYSISRAYFVTGSVKKTYDSPVFPLTIDLSSAETIRLKCGENVGYFIVYDQDTKKETCAGSVKFEVAPIRG